MHLTSAFISFYPTWGILFSHPNLGDCCGELGNVPFLCVPSDVFLSPPRHCVRTWFPSRAAHPLTSPTSRNNILGCLNPYSSHVGALRRKRLRRRLCSRVRTSRFPTCQASCIVSRFLKSEKRGSRSEVTSAPRLLPRVIRCAKPLTASDHRPLDDTSIRHRSIFLCP